MVQHGSNCQKEQTEGKEAFTAQHNLLGATVPTDLPVCVPAAPALHFVIALRSDRAEEGLGSQAQ